MFPSQVSPCLNRETITCPVKRSSRYCINKRFFHLATHGEKICRQPTQLALPCYWRFVQIACIRSNLHGPGITKLYFRHCIALILIGEPLFLTTCRRQSAPPLPTLQCILTV